MPEHASDQDRRARSRRQLDHGTIIDAALRLATQPDAGALSFRRLGAELGTDPTAVYRYFRDKDELVEAALDRLIGQAADAAAGVVSWRERLEVVAARYVEVVVAHPVIGAEAGHRTTAGPGEVAMLELLLASLTEAGLPPTRAVAYYQLIAGYVAAMAAAQAAYLLHDRRVSDAADRPWVRTAVGIDPDRFPVTVSLQAEIAALRERDVLVAGLGLILDAVAREAQEPRSTDGGPPPGSP